MPSPTPARREDESLEARPYRLPELFRRGERRGEGGGKKEGWKDHQYMARLSHLLRRNVTSGCFTFFPAYLEEEGGKGGGGEEKDMQAFHAISARLRSTTETKRGEEKNS